MRQIQDMNAYGDQEFISTVSVHKDSATTAQDHQPS
jgi:hypothetical protein